MSALYNYLMLTFHDVGGKEITVMYALQDQSELDTTPYDDLIDATQTLTDAGLSAVQLVTTKIYSATADAGPYDSSNDRAHFQGRCDDSTVKYFDIPAPVETIFDATTQRVDMSNPDVIAWINQLKLLVGNASGSPIVVVQRGNRQKIKPFPGL